MQLGNDSSSSEPLPKGGVSLKKSNQRVPRLGARGTAKSWGTKQETEEFNESPYPKWWDASIILPCSFNARAIWVTPMQEIKGLFCGQTEEPQRKPSK